MKLKSIACGVVLLVALAHLPAAAMPDPHLKSLYDGKQYFDLRDALLTSGADRSTELLFYRGVVSNKFNRPQESIAQLRSYLREAGESADAGVAKECYELLAANYVKTYQYRRAAEAYRTLLTKFGNRLDAKETADAENSAKLWGALGHVPRQTVTFKGDTRIQAAPVGKSQKFPVEANGRKVSIVVDTGANLSTAAASFAGKLGLRIIDATIEVGSITGNKVKARLGVAPKMKIGNATVRHAVFLVMDDKDLSFPDGFRIDGLIGFPVVSALREVTFGRGGEVVIPARPRGRGEQNMCLEHLTPVVAATHRGRRLAFTFDTGANTTLLYPPFYRAYEDEIKAKYSPQADRIAGAGGFKELTAYRLPEFALTVSGREARLARVKLLAEPTIDKSRYFYGNIGQDGIGQFERMTINFETMSVVFE